MQKILDVIRISEIICFAALTTGLWQGCSDKEKKIPPPEIFLPQGDKEIEVNQGDTIQIEPKITYNFNPKYEWRKNGKVLDHHSQLLIDTASQLGRIEYFFGITTPYGSDSALIPVDVIIMANFQELDLSEEKDTAWIGTAETNGFNHKNLFFPNHFQKTDSSWQGFGYSNMQSTQTSPPIPPYNVYNSSIEDSDNNIFGLVKQPMINNSPHPTISFTNGQEHRLKSIEMANSTLGHYRLKFGGDYFERMGGATSNAPDWYKVTMKGFDKNGTETGTVTFYLADYRYDNNKRDYIVENWTEVPLNELGSVHTVEFHLSSSKTNDEGKIITPGIFCIDNLKIKD